MVIAINNCSFGTYDPEMDFVSDLLLNIAPQYPENKFFFLMNRQPPKTDQLNIYYVQIAVTKNDGLLGGYQYQRAISAVLKKIKTDLFLTPFIFSQLFFKRKQVLILPGLGNLIYASDFGKAENNFFKKYILQSVKKAREIITSSESWKKLLVDKFQKNAEEVFIISGKFSTHDINNPTALNIKETYTNNDEYFLIADDQINKEKLIFILKSFSAFKKRMKSMMKMMFVLNSTALNECEGLIKNYKYRSDIVVMNKDNSPEITALIRNAYAVIINSNFGGFKSTNIIMNCLETAIISSETEYNKVSELAQDQALYYKPNNIMELSDQMMKIYKDENLRNSLIMKQKVLNNSIYQESNNQQLEKLFGYI